MKLNHSSFIWINIIKQFVWFSLIFRNGRYEIDFIIPCIFCKSYIYRFVWSSSLNVYKYIHIYIYILEIGIQLFFRILKKCDRVMLIKSDISSWFTESCKIWNLNRDATQPERIDASLIKCDLLTSHRTCRWKSAWKMLATSIPKNWTKNLQIISPIFGRTLTAAPVSLPKTCLIWSLRLGNDFG